MLIVGVFGCICFVYQGGGGQLLCFEGISNVSLIGIIFDGVNWLIGDFIEGFFYFVGVWGLVLDQCEIVGLIKFGLVFDCCFGWIENCKIVGVVEVGICFNEVIRLVIKGNMVIDCVNGGVLVYCWIEGEDGILVIGNCIEWIVVCFGGIG